MRNFLCLWLLTLFAVNVAAHNAVEQLRSLLSQTDSIGAEFVQIVENEQGEELQRSRGKIVAQRPLKVRWETTEPYRYLVVTDGETLWRYDADLEQLNREPFKADLAKTPVLILTTSTEKLESHFEVTVERKGDREIYTLTPRGEAGFEQLRLHFLENRLSDLELDDSLGQTTHIALQDPVFNREYDSDTFVFDKGSKSPEEAE